MSIVVIDYGSGNLRSAAKSLETAANNAQKNFKIEITSNPKKISQADKIVLPGQGSFRDCYLGIKKIPELAETLNEFVLEKKKPILGICVGMQLFAKVGHEFSETKGFGWFDAEVRKINNMNKKIKLPHMGWNEIEFKKDCFLFFNVKNKSHVYFTHSYEFMTNEKECVIATTNYGNPIIASVVKDNIIGTQFHPEKSQKNGLKILENFLKWKL
jgi:imidazole glycerol-phosphate synthase subunit HisH